MTAEEYFAVSVERDFTELIDGELVVSEPTLYHGLVQNNLLFELTVWGRAEPGRGLAFPPGDIVMDDFNVYAPDVMWIREERVPDPVREDRLSGLPDLAVEIRSPSTWRHVLKKKLPVYERFGVPELWLVDNVAESVRVLRRSGHKAAFDVAGELTGTDELTSLQLPGFAVAVERLFRR